MRAIFSVFFSFLFLLISHNAVAQTCCSGGVPVSGNVGLFPEEKSKLQLNLSYDYNLLKTLKDYSVTLEGSNRERITQSILFESSFSITHRLSIYGFLSWIQQERIISRNQSNDIVITRGIGDAVLMPGYLAINRPFIKWFLSGGVKFPMGKSDIKSSDGILLNPDLQPGSGAYDGIFLSILKYEAAKGNSFHQQLAYRKTGINNEYRGNDNYRFGNELVASIGWSRDILFLKRVSEISLNMSWRNAGVDNVNSNSIPNTGGNWVFFNTGLSLYLNQDLNVFGSLTIPLYSEPTGVQLSTTARISAGIYYSLDLNRNRKTIFF